MLTCVLLSFGMPQTASEPTSKAPTKRQGDDLAVGATKRPLVVCVCLTKDRPQMLQRAIGCFRAQSYQRKRMLVFDTSDKPSLPESKNPQVGVIHATGMGYHGVGYLRNFTAACFGGKQPPEIIVHWDDDDYSHPERLAEQVALLQASGKECVGYREMLFWRTPIGEAWLYTHGKPSYCLGTSLCYWRRVWEKRRFEDLKHGEDHAWLKGVDSLGVCRRVWENERIDPQQVKQRNYIGDPRMIASIHGGNTSPAYQHLEACERQGEKWKRVPTWDDYCRRTMEA